MKFSAVILAGGRSQRMGRDKAALEINGQSLLARQVELVRQCGTEEIFISSRGNADHAVPGCQVLHDHFADAGPLGGIERALEELRSPLLLVLAVDMPNMDAETLDRLGRRCSDFRGVVPRIGGRCEPLAAFYPKAAWALAGTMLNTGLKVATAFAEGCVQSNLAGFYDLDADNVCAFANWNRPEDIVVH